MNTNFKVALIGPEFSGKSSLIKRLLTGRFIGEYTPSTDTDTHIIKFSSNVGNITFQVYDYPGRKDIIDIDTYRYCSTRRQIKDITDLDMCTYQPADACIVLLREEDSPAHGKLYSDRFHTICPDAPVVVYFGKSDLVRGMSPGSLSPYKCYNIAEPFIELSKQLVSQDICLERLPTELISADELAQHPPNKNKIEYISLNGHCVNILNTPYHWLAD